MADEATTVTIGDMQTPSMTLDDLRNTKAPVVTVEDVSRLLGVDSRTIRRGCERGQLPSITVGRRVLIVREPLLALLEARPDAESNLSESIAQ